MKNISLLLMVQTVGTCNSLAIDCKDNKMFYVLMMQIVKSMFKIAEAEGEGERFKEMLVKYLDKRQKLVEGVCERYTPEELTKLAQELFDEAYKKHRGD